MQDLEPLLLKNWLGGLNRSVSDLDIGQNELWTAENCFLSAAAIIKRKGYEKFNDDVLDEATDVLSVFAFGAYVLANCGTIIYKIDAAGTATYLVEGLTSGYPVSYAVCDGIVYMSNGKDRPWKWNGTDAAEQLADALPKAKWLVLHRDKLFYVATIANPNYVYFSQAGLPETIDADAFFIVHTDDNEDLTGAASIFGYLMLFKPSSMHRLQGATKAQYLVSDNLVSAHPRIGCVAANTIVHVTGGLMFLSKEGVQFTDTSDLIKRSLKVDKFLDTIVQTYDYECSAFWDGTCYRVNYPMSGQFPNESLVYDLDVGCWSLFTYGMNAYTVATDGTIYAASAAGQVYVIDKGLSDDDVEIKMKVETGVFDFGSPFVTKIFRWAGVNFYRSNAAPQIILIVDRGASSWLYEFAVATGLTFWDIHDWAISAGTVTVTNGSVDVTGSAGVDWDEVAEGDSFQIDGEDTTYTVATIDAAAKTLTLNVVYAGVTDAGKEYCMWNGSTLIWIDPTLAYEKVSLPKRLKGKNIQIQFLESAADSELEIYSIDVRLLPMEGAR